MKSSKRIDIKSFPLWMISAVIDGVRIVDMRRFGIGYVICSLCLLSIGMEAAPIEDLEALLMERIPRLEETLGGCLKDVQEVMVRLRRVESNSPWDGLREIFATDLHFRREVPAGSCPFHLDKEGYLHEGGGWIRGGFHGTEEKFRKKNWKSLRGACVRLKAFFLRSAREMDIWANSIDAVRVAHENEEVLAPGFVDETIRTITDWENSPPSFPPEVLEFLEKLKREGEERRRRRNQKLEGYDHNSALEQLREETRAYTEYLEQSEQYMREILGSDEAVAQYWKNTDRIMKKYRKPRPPEDPPDLP
jgi:hypothetical protein